MTIRSCCILFVCIYISCYVRGNFNVSWEGEEKNVFHILRSACLTLAEVSFMIRQQSAKQNKQRLFAPITCYSRMMWSKLLIVL